MIRTALKSVVAHKVRLGLTAFAVVLGVSLVAGTFVFTDTINRQFDGLLDDIYAGIDVSVRADAGDFSAGTEPFPAAVLDDVLAVEGVAAAEGGVASITTQVLDPEGNPIGGGQGPPTLGFSWSEVAALNPMRISESNGRAPSGPGEVAIDVSTASKVGFAVGDEVTVVGFEGPETYELVGLATFGDQDTLLGATIVMFELDEARRVFGFGDEFSGIDVQADDGVDNEELAGAIGDVLPPGVAAVSGEAEQQTQADQIGEALSFINIGLLAFAAVAVFVGGFIIQNTFRIIVAQRTKELALLRAIGATGRQVRAMVVTEAVTVGLIASVVGLLFGIAMATGIRGLMNAAGFGVSGGGLVVLPRTVLISLAVGTILTVGSSLLPARKAARVPPVAAMNEEAARSPRKSLRTRAIAGSVVTGVGVAILLIGLFTSVANAIAFVGFGAATAFIGISILAPLAAGPLADVIGAPMPRLFGVSGVLAKENTKRQPRRTASTASALMIGVALVAFFSVFADSTKASVSDSIAELFPADLTFQSTGQNDPSVPAAMSPAFAEELRSYPELSVVSPMQFARVTIADGDEVIGAFDPATIEFVFSLDAVDGAVGATVERDAVIVSESRMEEEGWSIGDTLAVAYQPSDPVPSSIVGTFASDDFTDFYVSTETYLARARYVGDGVIFANTAEGVTIDEARAAIAPTIDAFGNVKAQTKSDIIEETEAQIDQALTLFTGLLLFAVLIAVLGITNTLTLSVFERTREIGLLRAVGMTRRQVRRMVRWEAVIVATFGALLGVIVGILLGWSVVRALADQGLGSFRIPFDQIVVALVLAAVAGIVAAIWPARKAARMNVLEAITTE